MTAAVREPATAIARDREGKIDIASELVILPSMNALPSRRWNPGFIALRWRHLFWGLPLLGLLTGLLVHFLPMIRHTATGVVQIRPGGSIVSIEPHVSAVSLPDINQVIRSEEILRATVQSQDLTRKWRLSEQACITELQDTIRCRIIPGTALAEIKVNGSSRAEAFRIWDSLIQHTKDHFHHIAQTEESANIAALDARVASLKAEVDAKREILSSMIGRSDLLHRFGANDHPSDHRFLKAKSDFEKAQADFQAAQIALISAKMQAKITEDPLINHHAPGTPVPVTLRDTLRPLVLHASIGLAAGMVLAVILAYLLELLFPRRTSIA